MQARSWHSRGPRFTDGRKRAQLLCSSVFPKGPQHNPFQPVYSLQVLCESTHVPMKDHGVITRLAGSREGVDSPVSMQQRTCSGNSCRACKMLLSFLGLGGLLTVVDFGQGAHSAAQWADCAQRVPCHDLLPTSHTCLSSLSAHSGLFSFPFSHFRLTPWFLGCRGDRTQTCHSGQGTRSCQVTENTVS